MSDKACGTCQYWALDGDLGVCPWDVMAGAPCYWWHKGHPCGNGLYAPYPPPEMARYKADSEMLDWIEANCFVAIPGRTGIACDHQGGVEDKPLRPKIRAAMEKGVGE
tara:strand:+ start:386 stop:709 length:324 start_codon:yes stop_codon:yes gene_type:complete